MLSISVLRSFVVGELALPPSEDALCRSLLRGLILFNPTAFSAGIPAPSARGVEVRLTTHSVEGASINDRPTPPFVWLARTRVNVVAWRATTIHPLLDQEIAIDLAQFRNKNPNDYMQIVEREAERQRYLNILEAIRQPLVDWANQIGG